MMRRPPPGPEPHSNADDSDGVSAPATAQAAVAAPAKALRQPSTMRGLAWMVAACAGWAATAIFVRMAANEAVHAVEVMFFRNLFGLVIIAPWMMRLGTRGLQTNRLSLHVLRSLALVCAMTGMYYAFTIMPMAEATALNFTTPLFATLGAMLILRERVGWRRWSALLVGFVGVLVVLRPGVEAFSFGAGLVLVSSLLGACGHVILKPLSRTDSAGAIVSYMMLLAVPVTLVAAALVWVWPSPLALGLMALAAATATVNQLAIARAFAEADVSVVLSIDFLRIVFVAVFAAVLFGEQPDLWDGVGAAIIVGASAYISRREALAAKRT